MFKAEVNGKTFQLDYNNTNWSVNGKKMEADILVTGKGRLHILHNNQSYNAEVISANRLEKKFKIRVNNHTYDVQVRDKYDELLHEMGIDDKTGIRVNDVKAPIPGMVLKVMVERGQIIKKGDTLIVLEAMKMENILKAPADGVIRKVHILKGDKVEKNQVLVDMQ